MQVARQDDLEAYFAYLRADPEEAQALLGDLLISVTTFFRDPKAFEALAAAGHSAAVRRTERPASR